MGRKSKKQDDKASAKATERRSFQFEMSGGSGNGFAMPTAIIRKKPAPSGFKSSP